MQGPINTGTYTTIWCNCVLEVLAIALPLVAVTLIVALYRSCLVGAALVLAMAAVKAWFVELPGIELGVMLYPGDAVSLALAVSGTLRIALKGALRVPPSALIFAGMLLLSFVLGLSEFGQSAGVDFRVIFAFIAGVFYFSSFEIDSTLLFSLARLWIGAACVLMLIAWFVWIADAAGLAMARKWIDADPTGVKFRVLNSGITYMIGVASVVLLHLLMNRQIAARWWPLLPILGGTVLVLQHRSVWVATFFSALPVVILADRGRARMLWFAGTVGLIAIALIPFMSHRLSGVSNSVSLQAERATNLSKGTSGGRIRAWEQLLKDWSKLSLGRQLIGKPFGSSYGGLTNAPHNCYLQIMYRTGYIGLLAMLAMYGGTVIRLLRRRHKEAAGEKGGETLLLGLMIGQLAFFVPYGFTSEQGVLLGTALAYVRRKLVRQSLEDTRSLNSAELSLASVSATKVTWPVVSLPNRTDAEPNLS